MPQFKRCSCTLKLGEFMGKMASIGDVIQLNAHRVSLVGKTGNTGEGCGQLSRERKDEGKRQKHQ